MKKPTAIGARVPALNLEFNNDDELLESFARYESITKKYFNDSPSITSGRNKKRNRDWFCELAGYTGGYQEFLALNSTNSTNKPNGTHDNHQEGDKVDLGKHLLCIDTEHVTNEVEYISFMLTTLRRYVTLFKDNDNVDIHEHLLALAEWLDYIVVPEGSWFGPSERTAENALQMETDPPEVIAHRYEEAFPHFLRDIAQLLAELEINLISTYIYNDSLPSELPPKTDVVDVFYDTQLKRKHPAIYRMLYKLTSKQKQSILQEVLIEECEHQCFGHYQDFLLLAEHNIWELQQATISAYVADKYPYDSSVLHEVFPMDASLIIDYYDQSISIDGVIGVTDAMMRFNIENPDVFLDTLSVIDACLIKKDCEELEQLEYSQFFRGLTVKVTDDDGNTRPIFRHHAQLLDEFASENAYFMSSKALHRNAVGFGEDDFFAKTFVPLFEVAELMVSNGFKPDWFANQFLAEHFKQQ